MQCALTVGPSQMNRSYSELMRYSDFLDRYEYLRLMGNVGDETFGWNRYLNQQFYRSKEWRKVRRDVILRDEGCDLGVRDREIVKGLIVHHITPITIDDVTNGSPLLFDPENLICVSDATHRAIHYGDASLLPQDPIDRMPNDTCPWR